MKVTGKGLSGLEDDDPLSPDLSEEAMENDLESFDKLLTQVRLFRPNTENMNRNERLNYAQQFAEVFEKLIMTDEDSPAENV